MKNERPLLLRHHLSLATLVAVILTMAALATACAGDSVVTTHEEELSIEERNAKASPAVAYASGADFAEALKRTGVPFPDPTITPYSASSPVGPVHVCDWVVYALAEGQEVTVMVAFPDSLSIEYFSTYYKSWTEAYAAANPGEGRMVLKGEYWFVQSPFDNQWLFDIQDALGGQLVVLRP